MVFVVTYVFGVALGVMLGVLISRMFRKHPVGSLRVDHSDPEGPYIFLELHESIEELSKQETILLNVRLEDYIPQK